MKRRPIRKRQRGGSRLGIHANALKLDAELTDRFCKYVRRGIAPETVADYLRIDRTTFWRWLQLGQTYAENEGQPEEYLVYYAFRQEYLKARARFLMKVTKELLRPDASPKHVKRAVEILRRRDPKQWVAPIRKWEEVMDDDNHQHPDVRYL